MAEREDGSPVTVGVPRERYNELMFKARKLDALEAAGVDSWEGMEEVKDILNDEGV